nr:hypothetical protein [Moorena sp. SIO3I6]
MSNFPSVKPKAIDLRSRYAIDLRSRYAIDLRSRYAIAFREGFGGQILII